MNKILSARRLVKDYGQGKTRLRVLQGVSLDVADGEFLVVVGASGAGKSTLLHLLGLLDTPTAGEVIVEGKSTASLSDRARAWRRTVHFGFVFQFFHLLPDFSALENVMLPAMVRFGVFGWSRARGGVRSRATGLLERVGLSDRLEHRPAELSGGERQRVALCRALINEPRVLLLDEPTGNLDSKTGAEIHDLIRDLNVSGSQTIVMVTHDERAAAHAHNVIRIRDGAIVSKK